MARRKKKEFGHYLKAAIRRIWGWDSQRRIAKGRATVGKDLYRCEKCGAKPLRPLQKQVDHIVPVDNPAGWDGWDNYIARMFCPAEGLQVLCNPCHHPKSESENVIRRARRKKESA